MQLLTYWILAIVLLFKNRMMINVQQVNNCIIYRCHKHLDTILRYGGLKFDSTDTCSLSRTINIKQVRKPTHSQLYMYNKVMPSCSSIFGIKNISCVSATFGRNMFCFDKHLGRYARNAHRNR
jgi:hypothetical protein